jgi:hypothetical protein
MTMLWCLWTIHSGHQRIYRMRTKDEMIKVVKKGHNAIAGIHARHNLVVLMQDNASENKQKEDQEFLTSKGVLNHSDFSTFMSSGRTDQQSQGSASS